MPENYDEANIVLERLRRDGLENLPIVGRILAVLFNIQDDIDAAKYKAEISNSLEELRQQLGNVLTLAELLEHPNTRELFERLKTDQSLKAINQSVNLDPINHFTANLKDPLHVRPNPELEAAIQTQAISDGTLMRKDRLPEQNGVIIEIGDVEIGKLFYPLHFIKQSIQANCECLDILHQPPLKALFVPSSYGGYPKWICVESENNNFTLTSFPKPIELDSSRTGINQRDAITVHLSKANDKFEYWPHKKRGPKFIVEMNFGNPVELKFQEKSNIDSPILCLQISYIER